MNGCRLLFFLFFIAHFTEDPAIQFMGISLAYLLLRNLPYEISFNILHALPSPNWQAFLKSDIAYDLNIMPILR